MSQKHTSTTVSKIYKSRNILLSILEKRGFDISEYKNFGINEIQIMFNNKQLDMLMENKNKKKIYIKYHIANKLRESHIYDYIEDLYNIENILGKDDELLIIMKDQNINNTLVEFMNFIYEKETIYVNIFKIKEFLFNILEHDIVPDHKRLTDMEKKQIYEKYQITNDKEMPEISRFDPVAKTIGLRPGELCEITRPSSNSISAKYYRLCQ
jgi:DNA-directed RNA polymerase subunit H (RpoH/RPB5)